MASKRAVLETLKVKDLVLLADKFDIQLENRRKKDDVVASVAKSRKAPIGELLGALPLATLKASCAALAIEGKGRSKADFVALLTGPAPKKKAPAKKTSAAAKATATKKKAVTKKKASAKPKAEKAPAKKTSAAAKATATKKKAVTKKKATAKPKAEKAPAKKTSTAAKKKTAAKAKVEETATKKKAVSKKKAAAEPKAKPAAAKKKTATKKKPETAVKAEQAPAKKKKTPKINKAVEAEVVPVKREADPEPRQAVLDKVASIKPAETSQPDYSKIKREPVGIEFRSIQCPSCSEALKIATCQAHQCSTEFISNQRKICASCWYERSSVSIGEYLDEEKIDTHCGSCSEEVDLEAAQTLKSA